MVKAIGLLALLALGACQTTASQDVFCQSHRQSDFVVSRATIAAMLPGVRRNALAVLHEGALKCGWKPAR